MVGYSTVTAGSFAQKKPRRKKFGENRKTMESKIKTEDNVSLKSHVPDCPIMLGKLDPMTECGCDGDYEEFHNTSLTVGLQLIADYLVDDFVGAGINAQIKYFEIGMDETAEAATDTGTGLVKARKNVVQAFRDTTNAVFKTFYNGTEANTNSAGVATGTSTTQFTLNSGGGSSFAIGQSVQISGGAFGAPENTVIQNIATDTITVSPALSTIPSGGETLEQLLVELVLYGGTNATSGQGTGIAFARTTNFTPRTKASGFGLTSEWRITLT